MLTLYNTITLSAETCKHCLYDQNQRSRKSNLEYVYVVTQECQESNYIYVDFYGVNLLINTIVPTRGGHAIHYTQIRLVYICSICHKALLRRLYIIAKCTGVKLVIECVGHLTKFVSLRLL